MVFDVRLPPRTSSGIILIVLSASGATSKTYVERRVDCRDRSWCIHLSIRPQNWMAHSYPTHSLTSASSWITFDTYDPHAIERHHFVIGTCCVRPPLSRFGMSEIRESCVARPYLSDDRFSRVELGDEDLSLQSFVVR